MKTQGVWGFYPLVPNADWARRLISWGVKTLQLRVKDASAAELRREISQTLEAGSKAGVQVIINDHWKLAMDLGASYIHLGQEDLDEADIPSLKSAGVAFGISTHSLDELDRALSFAPDYLALGPIFAPTGKQVDWTPQGVEKLQTWRERIDIPLVAIGGITLERATSVMDAGAQSIAVIGDVVFAENPKKRVEEWLTFFESYHKET